MKKMKYFILSTLLLTCGAFTSCNKVDTIMVVGVHHDDRFDEIDILINSLNYRNQEQIDGINFYTGRIGTKDVVVAETALRMSGAAMTTTIGIKQYHPNYVISEGTSGGHHSGLTYNDIILGKDILDLSSYKGPGDDPSKWELKNPPLHADEDLLKKASKVKNTYGNLLKSDGVIASSDAWNTDKSFIEKLYGKFQEDCEEMEAYAVTSVCNNYKIPSLAIKVISNNASIDEEFKTEPGKNCQRYVIDVINAI